MSVIKNTPNFLKHSGLSFTTIVNETIDLIPDAGALGIYCYLASKSENWNICNVHLQNRFKKGRDYIKKKISILKEIGLIKTVAIKNEKGVILHWETSLINHLSTHNTENPYCGEKLSTVHNTENPASGKPRRLEKPPLLNKRSSPIKERSKIKERERKPVAIKRLPLSDSWMPDQERQELVTLSANKNQCTIDYLINKFRMVSKSTGQTSVDWQAAFALFLSRERPSLNQFDKSIPAVKSSIDFVPQRADIIERSSPETAHKHLSKIMEGLNGRTKPRGNKEAN